MSKKYEIINDSYVVLTKEGSEIKVSKKKHSELLVDYCVKKESVENICLKYGMSSSKLERYKRMVGFSRDTIPVSDEEVLDLSEDDLANLIVERKASALEKAQDLYVERIAKDAANWRDFVSGSLNPFENAIKNFTPKTPIKPSGIKTVRNGRFFTVCLSDLQIGLLADPKNLFRQQKWNTEIAKKALGNLLRKIAEDINNDKVGFEGAVLILAGDLIHGLRGETEKGTRLEVDLYEESQCDALLDILQSFVSTLFTMFGSLTVHSVKGNHDGADHYPILMALKSYYRTINNIKINVYSSRTATFKISDTLVVLDHGASDKYKADIPRDGKQRESYIQSLLLSKSEEYSKCKSCLFIQGDKHHYEQKEYNDFEYIMVGALPLGDRYSDNNNFNARPRQNCLIIDKTGLKSVLHYYIDQCI